MTKKTSHPPPIHHPPPPPRSQVPEGKFTNHPAGGSHRIKHTSGKTLKDPGLCRPAALEPESAPSTAEAWVGTATHIQLRRGASQHTEWWEEKEATSNIPRSLKEQEMRTPGEHPGRGATQEARGFPAGPSKEEQIQVGLARFPEILFWPAGGRSSTLAPKPTAGRRQEAGS